LQLLGPNADGSPLLLAVGTEQTRIGWLVMDVDDQAGVDLLGNGAELPFVDNCVDIVYTSTLPTLSFADLQSCLAESFRVLKPGGQLYLTVPDLDEVCALFLDRSLPQAVRQECVKVLYGGQSHARDFHSSGLNFELLLNELLDAGFNKEATRVTDGGFGLFDDDSGQTIAGQLVSLNVIIEK
jgi:predicted SAM-dependent methyltransferase